MILRGNRSAECEEEVAEGMRQAEGKMREGLGSEEVEMQLRLCAELM